MAVQRGAKGPADTMRIKETKTAKMMEYQRVRTNSNGRAGASQTQPARRGALLTFKAPALAHAAGRLHTNAGVEGEVC